MNNTSARTPVRTFLAIVLCELGPVTTLPHGCKEIGEPVRLDIRHDIYDRTLHCIT
jgi:hypothetical protein